MTETITPTSTGNTTAITARDFTPATDHRHVAWNAGALRHVIAALNGAPVVITLDVQTGNTMIGAVLIGVRHGVRSNHPEVLVRYYTGQVVAHTIFNLGEVIIPLVDETDTQGAKWKSLASYRSERAAAITKANAEHGKSEGREWGKWDAKLFVDTAQVTYKPHVHNPHYADRTGERGLWEYAVADLA